MRTHGLLLACVLNLSAIFGIVAARAELLLLDVAAAALGLDQRTNVPFVSVTLTEESGRLFADFTGRNVGRTIEMRVDGQTLMKPVIREPILGRTVQISGAFSASQAKDVASRLSAGTSKLEIELVPN